MVQAVSAGLQSDAKTDSFAAVGYKPTVTINKTFHDDNAIEVSAGLQPDAQSMTATCINNIQTLLIQ